jgi:hypothetical protein
LLELDKCTFKFGREKYMRAFYPSNKQLGTKDLDIQSQNIDILDVDVSAIK